MSDEVKKFLETMAAAMSAKKPENSRYGSIYEFVLVNGKSYDPPKDGPGMLNNECFKNAYYMSVGNPYLTYVEGYATTGFLPVYHAWCVDEFDNVIYPTWGTKGTGYYGVPFPMEYVNHVMATSGHYGVIDSWTGDGPAWPLLTGEHGYEMSAATMKSVSRPSRASMYGWSSG